MKGVRIKPEVRGRVRKSGQEIRNGGTPGQAGNHPSREAQPSFSFDRAGWPGAIKYRRLLAGTDLVAIALAVALAAWIGQESGRDVSASNLILPALAALPLWILFAYGAGLYHDFERRVERNLLGISINLAIVSTAWVWIVALFRSGFHDGPTDLLTGVVLWIGLLILLPFGRIVSRSVAIRLGWLTQKTVLIGGRTELSDISEKIGRHPEWHLEPDLMIVTPDSSSGNGSPKSGIAENPMITGLALTGPPDAPSRAEENGVVLEGTTEFLDFLGQSGADRVIITGRSGGLGDPADRSLFLHELMVRGFAVDLLAGGSEMVYSQALVHDYEGAPVLTFKPTRRRKLSLVLKRASDVVLAATGLLVLSPVIGWAAIRIKLDSDGPVFFRQIRQGLDGQSFEIIKLRTMVDGAHEMREGLRAATIDEGNDDVLFKLEDDPRVTDVGRTLRVWSIDEIPQLWNVLNGEMSMVGPRPLVPDESVQADLLFPGRLTVKPGVAGPWQALGRSEIPFEDMVRLDLSYALGSSTLEDYRLLLRTAIAVLRRRGAV